MILLQLLITQGYCHPRICLYWKREFLIEFEILRKNEEQWISFYNTKTFLAYFKTFLFDDNLVSKLEHKNLQYFYKYLDFFIYFMIILADTYFFWYLITSNWCCWWLWCCGCGRGKNVAKGNIKQSSANASLNFSSRFNYK